MTELSPEARAIVEGYHSDPFRYLGPHVVNGKPLVRAFLPGADEVSVVEGTDGERALARIDAAGLFEGPVKATDRRYHFKARWNGETVEVEDAYRFPPVLSDFDLYLLGEGTHLAAYEKIGAHPKALDGVAGVAFVVFAPNAQRVSVVGDFNFWDGRRHAMRVRGNGFWEIFVPGAAVGHKYKFEVSPRGGGLLVKSDPFAFEAEVRPATASVIVDLARLKRPTPAPAGVNRLDAPISIYEVHLGSWRRKAEDDHRWLTYRELADVLPAYVADLGFTHVEFLPVMEHPFDGSWGYQPTGMYAPTSRFGPPEDFLALVDAFHQAGIAVLLDWVPGHFPDDPHALGRFDGTAVYEHANPVQGRHLDWNTLIYNFGRREVSNFLLANALFWLDRYGADGLRVDAVASMLYLDYSRPEGGWIPNKYGGRENLEAIDLLRRFNTEVFGRYPQRHHDGRRIHRLAAGLAPGRCRRARLRLQVEHGVDARYPATTSRSDPMLSQASPRRTSPSGCSTRSSRTSCCRSPTTRWCTGRARSLGRMPGDRWQRFANLRAYYTFMFGHPGKKLIFMAQRVRPGARVDATTTASTGICSSQKRAPLACKDLDPRPQPSSTKTLPALHAARVRARPASSGLSSTTPTQSVFAWLRRGPRPGLRLCIVVRQFHTRRPRPSYRMRVPFGGGVARGVQQRRRSLRRRQRRQCRTRRGDRHRRQRRVEPGVAAARRHLSGAGAA